MARKAPLVASDSSSSSSSDSDGEEGKASTRETITTGAGKETIRLTVDAKSETALFSRSDHPDYILLQLRGLSEAVEVIDE